MAAAAARAAAGGLGRTPPSPWPRCHALPFAGATFDGAIRFNVLDFTPGPGAALLELRRVLKPGARLIVETLGARSPVKAQTWRRFLPDAAVPPIANQILPWETEALLGALGWRILGGRPLFGPAASGAANAYDAARAAALADPILQQTVATAWQIVAQKPAGSEHVELARRDGAVEAEGVGRGREGAGDRVDHQAAAARARHDAVAAVAAVDVQPRHRRWGRGRGGGRACRRTGPPAGTSGRCCRSQTSRQKGLMRATACGLAGSSRPKAKSALVGTSSSGGPGGTPGAVQSR